MLFFVFFLILAIILQSSVTTVPLVLIVLLNFAVASKKRSVLFIAFFCGLLIDIVLLNPLGQTSLFFVVVLTIVIIYERKYDTQTFPFVFIASFLGSFSYLILYKSGFILIQSIVASLFSLLFFWAVIQADKIQLGPKKMLYER